MVKLIADIGATASKWVIAIDGQPHQFVTSDGFNPYQKDITELQRILDGLNLPEKRKVTNVHLFGAGFLQEKVSEIEALIATNFPSANEIQVSDDLLGSCIAHSSGTESIVSALGTGSCHAHFDGENIVKQITSWGHLFNDEGAGYQIGQSIVSLGLRDQLTSLAGQVFKTQNPNGFADIKPKAYDIETQASYIASFARYASAYQSLPEISRVVDKIFANFTETIIIDGYNKTNLPHTFTGSVALAFEQPLRKALTSSGIANNQIKISTASTIEGLAQQLG